MPQLHLGVASQHGPLTVFPVWTDAPLRSSRRYTTATSRGATVCELPDGPEVGRLSVTHEGRRPRVLFGGTLLEAGWQHRVLLHDVAVAADEHAIVDVACVEQRRWGGDHTQHPGRRMAPLAVRGASHGLRADPRRTEHQPNRGHHPNLQHGAPPERQSDQGDVWARVAHYERLHGRSATSSLVEVAQRLDHEVARLVGRLQPLPGQRGLLLGIGGRPALLEVFDHPRTLAEQWSGILGSVWMDAQRSPTLRTPGSRARAFVAGVSGRPVQAVAPSGVGHRVSVGDGGQVSGRGLTLGATLVHVEVLSAAHRLVVAA
jgi:hypothetical protein